MVGKAGRSSVRVRVPATSANLGPGFDALGIALDVFEEVQLARLPQDAGAPRIRVHGSSAGRLRQDTNLLAYRGVAAVYARLGRPVPPLALDLFTGIPYARGLGSSAAAIVGGITAANAIEGSPLAEAALLEIATALEGHPDNVAPALLGGLVVSVQGAAGVTSKRLEPPGELLAVLCIPEQSSSTKHARGLIPKHVPLADAVFNLGRTALLVAAFATRDWPLLREAMEDRLHQPARGTAFPALHPTIRAALDAGAHGAALSGAGSTIIAFATERTDQIAEAMRRAAEAAGYPSAAAVVRPVGRGATLV